jgi:hypothetical protein
MDEIPKMPPDQIPGLIAGQIGYGARNPLNDTPSTQQLDEIQAVIHEY